MGRGWRGRAADHCAQRGKMRITYDPEVDILRILWDAAPIESSDEAAPGAIVDYDAEGNAVGLEILDASTQIETTEAIEALIAAVQTRESQGASPD